MKKAYRISILLLIFSAAILVFGSNSMSAASGDGGLRPLGYLSPTNATIVSDDGSGWNLDSSNSPSVTMDSAGNVHVVWSDDTDVPGYTFDRQIMYCNFTRH